MVQYQELLPLKNGVTAMSIVKTSGNGVKMSLNQLILIQITLNLITMNKTKELEQLFEEKFGEGSLEFAIEQGFDKEELLNNI
jgi:hypothetical protein